MVIQYDYRVTLYRAVIVYCIGICNTTVLVHSAIVTEIIVLFLNSRFSYFHVISLQFRVSSLVLELRITNFCNGRLFCNLLCTG